MSNPFVYLNKSYLKKDGSYAIYIVINIDNQTLRFPTGVSCKLNDFIEETQRIRGTTKKAKDANLCIERSLSILNDIMVRYRLSNEVLTADALCNEWKNPSRRVDFHSILDGNSM